MKKDNLMAGNFAVKKEESVYHWPVLTLGLSFLFVLLQSTPAVQSGTSGVVLGVVKHPESSAPMAGAHVLLLPPKYTEQWSRQVQTRMDNYWEMFKPEFYANKQRVVEF